MRLEHANQTLKAAGIGLFIIAVVPRCRGGRKWARNNGYVILNSEPNALAGHWVKTIDQALQTAQSATWIINKQGLKIWKFDQ